MGLQEGIRAIAILLIVECQRTRSLTSAFFVHNAYGPSWNICLISRFTKHIQQYAQSSRYIHEVYAAQRLYTYSTASESTSGEDYAYHPKLSHLLTAMERDNCDYFVWMDADLIPLDLSFRFEEVILNHSDAHILISADVSNAVNTGCMILRNSQFCYDLLTRWLSLRSHPLAINDQSGFDILYATLSASQLSKIKILRPEILNSIAPAMGHQEPSHKILHLAAESNEYRAAVFALAAKEVHNSVISGATPVLQLGLTRQKLQELAVAIYGRQEKECIHQLGSFICHRASFHAGAVTALVDVMSSYRMVVSKYLHAIVYASTSGMETVETLQRRYDAFHIALCTLYTFLDILEEPFYPPPTAQVNGTLPQYTGVICRDMTHCNGSVASQKLLSDDVELDAIQEVPELLKLSAELGFEYLVVSDSIVSNKEHIPFEVDRYSEYLNLQERRHHVVQVLVELLDMLEQRVHPHQRSIVTSMQDGLRHFLSWHKKQETDEQ